jgi:uncharacterized lipoprotein YehR (DUF1307 family)
MNEKPQALVHRWLRIALVAFAASVLLAGCGSKGISGTYVDNTAPTLGTQTVTFTSDGQWTWSNSLSGSTSTGTYELNGDTLSMTQSDGSSLPDCTVTDNSVACKSGWTFIKA